MYVTSSRYSVIVTVSTEVESDEDDDEDKVAEEDNVVDFPLWENDVSVGFSEVESTSE